LKNLHINLHNMKAILEFSLPDDREEYMRTVKATDMASVLWEITYNLKKRAEHEFDARKENDGAFDAIEFIFNEIYGALDENNVNIDELYT